MFRGNPASLGRFLLAQRTLIGISQDQLSERTAISKARISALENGRGVNITIRTLLYLARGLNMEPIRLLYAWTPDVDWLAPGGWRDPSPPPKLPKPIKPRRSDVYQPP